LAAYVTWVQSLPWCGLLLLILPSLGPPALCYCPLFLAVLLCQYGMLMARLPGFLVLNPCPRLVLLYLLPCSLCRLLPVDRWLAGLLLNAPTPPLCLLHLRGGPALHLPCI
jgi:hypothetical protein